MTYLYPLIPLIVLVLTAVLLRGYGIRTLSAAFPVAFAILIALESVFLNIISAIELIDRKSVLSYHLLIIASLSYLTYKQRGNLNIWSLSAISRSLTHPVFFLFLPLLILTVLASYLYPPNNYDTITYHMARVAHWMQNQSIGYYLTPIERQNVMGPGAEYLILVLQILTQADTWANFVQVTAYVLLIPAGFYLCRLCRINRELAPWIVLLTATAPITVFQVSTAKNDIVAALVTYAILISGRRFIFGNVINLRAGDYITLSLSLAAAYLVKPTALVIALPILAAGMIRDVFQNVMVLKAWRGALRGVIIAGVLFAIVAGPDVYRKINNGMDRHEVYPLFSEYTVDRLWNPVRIMAHNLPFPEKAKQLYYDLGGRGSFDIRSVFNPQEDVVGNPYQMATFLFLTIISVITILWQVSQKKLSSSVLVTLLPVLSWLSFGLIVRDQTWMTRLQIPLFYLLPLSFAVVGRYKRGYRYVYITTIVAAIVSLTYALTTASNISTRPLAIVHFWGEKPNRIPEYYNNAPLKKDHDFFIEAAKNNACKQVGLILGPDSVEYPLTWRLMQQGISVSHLWGKGGGADLPKWVKNESAFDSVCAIYVADGSREYVPEQGVKWLSAGDYHTFIKNYSHYFTMPCKACVHIDKDNYSQFFFNLNQTNVSLSGEYIKLTSLGEDPFFEVGIENLYEKKDLMLQLTLQSPVESRVQLFYKSEKDDGYSEQQSIVKLIDKGRNVVYFQVPKSQNVRYLRLDIGHKPGDYLLKSLEIRSTDK